MADEPGSQSRTSAILLAHIYGVEGQEGAIPSNGEKKELSPNRFTMSIKLKNTRRTLELLLQEPHRHFVKLHPRLSCDG